MHRSAHARSTDSPTGGIKALVTSAFRVAYKSTKEKKAEQFYDRNVEDISEKSQALNDFYHANQTVIEGAFVKIASLDIDGKSIESAINGFAETSKVVIKGLDALAQVHPFVGVAVVAFKTVISLDISRRENNKKVQALYLDMQDLMAILFRLRDMKDPEERGHDGLPLKGRLQDILLEKGGEPLAAGNHSTTGKRVDELGAARERLSKELSENVEEAIAEFHQEAENHIITAVFSGAHDRILDPVCILKYFKTHRFNFASGSTRDLEEHGMEGKREGASLRIGPPRLLCGKICESIRSAGPPVSPLTGYTGTPLALADSETGDRWVLPYLDVPHVQAILEAIDDDGTGFITINEVNTFTESRPKIRRFVHIVFSKGLHTGLLLILPFSTPASGDLKAAPLNTICQRLRRFHTPGARYAYQAYELDTPATVALVTGPGRIGRYLYPLLFLLLRRYVKIMKIASKHILHVDEFTILTQSIKSVLQAVNERIRVLVAVFKQTHLDVRNRLGNVAFGMFQLIFDGVERNPSTYSFFDWEDTSEEIIDDDIDVDKIPPGMLKYEVEDIFEYDEYVKPQSLNDARTSIDGLWAGHCYAYDSDEIRHKGLLQITISPTASGSGITGNGEGRIGLLSITGTIDETGADTTKVALMLSYKDGYTMRCTGIFDPQTDTIKGDWNPGRVVEFDDEGVDEDSVLRVVSAEGDDRGGNDTNLSATPMRTFEFTRTPSHFYKFRHKLGSQPTARSRWLFACSAIRQQVRQQLWSWNHIQAHCRERRRFMDLITRRRIHRDGYTPFQPLSQSEVAELANMERNICPSDTRLYTLCVDFQIRKIPHHLYVLVKSASPLAGALSELAQYSGLFVSLDEPRQVLESQMHSSVPAPRIVVPPVPYDAHEIGGQTFESAYHAAYEPFETRRAEEWYDHGVDRITTSAESNNWKFANDFYRDNQITIAEAAVNIASHIDGKSVEIPSIDRLQDLMGKIAKDVTECGSACDVYMKKSFLAKMIRSRIYEERLAGYATLFETNRAMLMRSLSVHSALGVDEANIKLDEHGKKLRSVEGKLDKITDLFHKLESPREHDVRKFIEDNDGAKACIDNDSLLTKLLEQGGESLLLKELSEDVGDAIQKNLALFGRKLEIQRKQLENTIHEEGKHIITTLSAGAHDRILDPDLEKYGVEGNAVKHVTLYWPRDYYAEDCDRVTAFPPVMPELTISILEAVDDDGTGFISIKEVNTFTTLRPDGWTLLQWIAYWAAGWHLSVSDYKNRIYILVKRLFSLVEDVLPANRNIANASLFDPCFWRLERLLHSTHSVSDAVSTHPELARIIKQYNEYEESRLDASLQSIGYELDTAATVALVTVCLSPVISPARHHVKIMKLAPKHILHADEFTIPNQSMKSIFQAVDERIQVLAAVLKQTHSDIRNLEGVAFGMFLLIFDGVERNPSTYSFFDWEDTSEEPISDDADVDEIP
ncbi:hypothetical protein BD779DRAFT_1674866 [Infundibulicybe gibba]|nr:hypothetical protein BD779DRAFT_1674866 [Infundibulicybe gibba]